MCMYMDERHDSDVNFLKKSNTQIHHYTVTRSSSLICILLHTGTCNKLESWAVVQHDMCLHVTYMSHQSKHV